MPVGAPTLRGGAALGRRDLPPAEEASSTTPGYATNVGDEGGFAPSLGGNVKAIEVILDGDREGGLPPGRGRPPRARPRGLRALRRREAAATSSRSRAASSRARSWSISGSTGATRFPIVSLEDGMAEDDWDGWTLLDRAARRPRPARRRRPPRHERRAHRARDPREGLQRPALQGQPDRHADREHRRGRDEPPRRLGGGGQPPLGRDGGHDDRGPRRRARHGPDQDGRARAQRPRREVQPAAPHRGGAGRPGGLPGSRARSGSSEPTSRPGARQPGAHATDARDQRGGGGVVRRARLAALDLARGSARRAACPARRPTGRTGCRPRSRSARTPCARRARPARRGSAA